ncbi:acyl-CoA thioesterase [Amycolatopsis lurida]
MIHIPYGDATSVPGIVNRSPLADRLALDHTGARAAGLPPHGFDQRLFGGHLLGQVVLAAGARSPGDRVVESLHVYFLRPGKPDGRIEYGVRAVREGRTRSVLAVSAEQNGRELLTGLVSLGPEGAGEPVPAVAPVVPAPESLPTLAERRARGLAEDGVRLPPLGDWRTASRPIDIRPVDGDPGGQRCLWFRTEPVADADPHLRRALLAFASDRSLLPVIARARGEREPYRPTASVDHAMWFHTTPVAGRWYLYVQDCPAAGPDGGVARGLVFDEDRRAVASVAQHGVVLPR